MTSKKPILCGPCDQGKVNSKADIWCYNCDEGLCATCLIHHKRSKGTHAHKTVDIKSYKPSNPDIKTESDRHGQLLNLYCTSHLMPGCSKCIFNSHSNCKEMESLEDVVEQTNLEKSMKTVDTDINSILYFLDKLVNTKSKSIKAGERICIDKKKSGGKIKKEINKHLDLLEKKICEETDTICNQEKSKAADFISEIKRKRENLKVIKENVHTITEHKHSKLQSFLGVYQIEQQVHQFQRYTDNLKNDDRAKDIDIKIKQNDQIESIIRKLGALTSLGEVMVVKKDIYLRVEMEVKKEAQTEARVQHKVNNVIINIESKTETNIRKMIRSMLSLRDGRVFLVGEDNKMNNITADEKLEKDLAIPGKAWSVTQINQDIIAITYPFERAIKVFNMAKETVIKVITLDKVCYGVSFFNNYLAVSCGGYVGGSEIHIIDLEGNTQFRVIRSSLTLFSIMIE